MTSRDAANTAKALVEALPLTGVVLTKVDGDARGGAALSIRHITGKPIKFLSVLARKLRRWSRSIRTARVAYSRHGRRTVADRRHRRCVDRAQAEKLASKLKKARRLRSQRLPRAAAADEKYGRHGQLDGQTAGHGADPG